MERRKSPPPDRALRTPRLTLPHGACDTHLHIFGPQARFPLAPARRLDVEDCTLDDLLALQQALGLSRGVLVQSFQHGHSYEYMLHALGRAPQRLRGVAAPAPDVTDAELAALTKAGVVGARFVCTGTNPLDTRMIERVRGFGWLPHFMAEGGEKLRGWREAILALPDRFVLEHMGWPPVEEGLDSEAFRFILRCLDTGRCWVKLSPRISKQPVLPFSDTRPFVQALVARAPSRLLWGSDWPHPNYFNPMPNDADLVDLLLDWVPDETVRKLILVDNPAEVFGFR